MSIREYISHENLSWADIPVWRKIVLVACLLAVGYLGGNAVQQIKTYWWNPKIPVAQHGQVYALHVMHGSLRYVTLQELEQFRNSQDRANLVGIPFVIAFLTLLTAKKS